MLSVYDSDDDNVIKIYGCFRIILALHNISSVLDIDMSMVLCNWSQIWRDWVQFKLRVTLIIIFKTIAKQSIEKHSSLWRHQYQTHKTMWYNEYFGFNTRWVNLKSIQTVAHTFPRDQCLTSPIASFMGPTWGPSGAVRAQVGPMNFVIRDMMYIGASCVIIGHFYWYGLTLIPAIICPVKCGVKLLIHQNDDVCVAV